MKTVALNAKLPLLVVGAFLLVLALSVIRVQAAPVTCASGSAVCPYFVTRGSDLFAGGWFENGGSCAASGANYQSPQVQGSTNANYYGAVMAFGTQSRAGASSDLGAFALGVIEGDATNNYGFTTGPANYKDLSFANVSVPASNWGGAFEGSSSYGNCIPDYYGTKQTSVSNAGSINPNAANGNYTVSGNTSLGTSTIAASKNLAYFVINGNLTITGNVTYGPHTASTSPKFVVVVKGNIYIQPGVTQLDGWYIAQPDGTTGGTIWTCHDGSANDPTDVWMRASVGGVPRCGNSLTVNGALTAKQVNLGRIAGGLFGAPVSAETVNYTPEMLMGGAFFNEQNANSGKIQSLVSLPPVF